MLAFDEEFEAVFFFVPFFLGVVVDDPAFRVDFFFRVPPPPLPPPLSAPSPPSFLDWRLADRVPLLDAFERVLGGGASSIGGGASFSNAGSDASPDSL